MDTYANVLFIIGALAIVLLIGMLKNRAEWIINLALRGISGMLGIYFLNLFLAGRVPGIEIGYNLITFLTSAILGFPGVAMLYGINFYLIL